MDLSSSRPRAAAIDGDEQDVTTSWRKLYKYTQRPGVAARAKRKIRRRERQQGKRECREGQ